MALCQPTAQTLRSPKAPQARAHSPTRAHASLVHDEQRSRRRVARRDGSGDCSGIEVLIAAAGGAAHLAGVVAAHTLLPVFGVPIESHALKGLDSLLSTVQMPAGIPVGTLAIGKPGAINAALLAVAILANSRPELRDTLRDYRAAQAAKIEAETLE